MIRKIKIVIAVFFFGMALISGFISPQISIVFSLLSFLVFPVMLLLLIISIFYRVKHQSKAYIFLILFIIFFFFYGSRIFQFSINKKSSVPTLKVLSYNVGRFKQGVNPHKLNEQLNKFFTFLEEEKVDIICFQEFSFVTRNLKNDLERLGYQDIMFKHPKRGHQNIREIFFTRQEYFDSKVVVNGEKEDLGSATKIVFNSDTILFLNTHIKSYNIKGKHPFKQSSIEESVQAIKRIFYNIRQYVHDQVNQINVLLNYSKGSGKVILCGDFNSLPSSYLYSRVSQTFNNSFEEAGDGFGFTYLGKTLFFLRIDNHFYKGNRLKPIKFQELDFGFSDHKATYGEYDVH